MSGVETEQREIPRVERPSPRCFRRRHVLPGRPALLTGIASRWRAVERWSPDFFREHYADARVRFIERDAIPPDTPAAERCMLDVATSRRRHDTSLREFVDGMAASDGHTRYLIFSDLLERHAELRGDLGALDAYQLSPLLPGRLRRALSRPPLFWMGPGSLASPLHLDVVSNLFVQVYGKKDWLLFPPGATPEVYFPCAEHPDEYLNWSPVDPERPDPERFPRYVDARPLRLTVGPGDILFVPGGWWHAVLYHEPSISLTYFWYGPWASTVGCRRIHAERLRRWLRALPVRVRRAAAA